MDLKQICIVKGDKFAAAQAAAARNIPFVFVRETRKSGHIETIGEVSDMHIGQLAEWFNEEPCEAPFPVGALLFFTAA